MKTRSLMVVVGLCFILSVIGCSSGGALVDGPPDINKNFTIEDSGLPLEALRVVFSTLYKHPDTGNLHLFMQYGNNNGYGMGENEWDDTAHRLVDIELESGEMRRAKTSKPGGVTSSHYLHPNGKLYLFEVKTKPANIAEFDTRTGKYTYIGALGNTAYQVRLTPTGKIFMGEVSGDVSVYDPEINRLSRFIRPYGYPIHWGVYSMEVEEPWIYCGMTNQGKWWLTVINNETGEINHYFDDKDGGGRVHKTEAGNIFFRNYPLVDGKPQMDDDGKPIPLEEPDNSPQIPANRRWENMWRVTGYGGTVYDDTNEIGIEFDMEDAEPNNWNGGVSTIRWREEGEEDWKVIEVHGLELRSMSPKALAVAPNGKFIGMGPLYGSLFSFDPETGISEEIGNSPGSIYQILPMEDRTYFCGYTSFFGIYEHDKPYEMQRGQGWDEDTNPRRFRTAARWTTAMIEGPDGKIYMGGKDGRHMPGGGFSIFDPETEEMKNIRMPWFEFLGVDRLTLVQGGKTLLITTRPVGQGAPDKGSIFFFDIERQEIDHEVKLDIPANPEQMLVVGDSTVVGVSRARETDEYGRVTNFTLVFGFDLEEEELIFEKRYPGKAFTGACGYDTTPMVRGPDGCGWLFVDEALCRIHSDGTLEVVRDNMDYLGHLVWRDSELYIYNGGRAYIGLFPNIVRIADMFK